MFQVNPLLGFHMQKKSSLIFIKNKSKKLKCRLLQVLFSALRVNLHLRLLLREKLPNTAKALHFAENCLGSKLAMRVHYRWMDG